MSSIYIVLDIVFVDSTKYQKIQRRCILSQEKLYVTKEEKNKTKTHAL